MGELCMFTKLEDTIHFVFLAFNGKKRIKENIELAYHSISVGLMLMEYGVAQREINY